MDAAQTQQHRFTQQQLPVALLSQVFASVVVAADGTVSLVLPTEPGDVLEFVHGARIDGGDFHDLLDGEPLDPGDDAAVAAALEAADDAIRSGRCAVVLDDG